MRRNLRARAFSLLVFLLAPAALPAQKSLHWRRLEVAARLDAQGVLHVAERQAIVFTGD
jgi:predicted amidohydrolase